MPRTTHSKNARAANNDTDVATPGGHRDGEERHVGAQSPDDRFDAERTGAEARSDRC